MNIVTHLEAWHELRTSSSGTLGLVHTMGNLHAGHISLCKRARDENDKVVVCIFVNPTQFNDAQDFELYPRTLAEDQALLKAEKIDFLLIPKTEALYLDQYEVQLSELKLASVLEGVYRPGHFTGMLTIVLKVLNLTCPTRAYYGEKDFQQLLLIQKMAQALFLPMQIIGCPTVRERDGLALSSRNRRLTPSQRQLASHFYRLLSSSLKSSEIVVQLEDLGFKVDYIAENWGRRLGAVWLGQVRLIDNYIL